MRSDFVFQCGVFGGEVSGDRCRYSGESERIRRCLPGDFITNWKKYSGLHGRVPPDSRSFEAKEYYRVLGMLGGSKTRIFFLQRDMELDRLMRLDLKGYKRAMVYDQPQNLAKTLLRLAWMTRDVTKGAAKLAGTEAYTLHREMPYAKLFDSETVVEQIGSLLKLARAFELKDSIYALTTDTLSKKLGSAGPTGAVSVLENVGTPEDAAREIIQTAAREISLQTPEVTQEEIDILRTQHIESNLLDDVLQESYRVNHSHRLETERLAAENDRLARELILWEGKERQRAENFIIESCGNST